MRIGSALAALHHDEHDLAQALLRLADEHRADHEVDQLGRDLAAWSTRHLREIAGVASRFGDQLDPAPDDGPTLAGEARRWLADRRGRTPEAELVLVRDLRDVYVRACGVQADWEMIGQAAQAIVDSELLDLATRCQGETRRQAAWARAKLKELATQALVV